MLEIALRSAEYQSVSAGGPVSEGWRGVDSPGASYTSMGISKEEPKRYKRVVQGPVDKYLKLKYLVVLIYIEAGPSRGS